ncbi:SAM-dependent methyltransferase [Novosphingobium hassiacum]|uniref:SAM-dependent methyltransferase n=1 Tax=Novosphingobium hassiacum TaxID=173676 RepID=A0A7W6EXK2_9SPHN|nr:hypothetical protein [Novosphingobium hassiacum]MBB3862472.1 SAM-dependent methyltransferase [Novosphingobium hassiacum]
MTKLGMPDLRSSSNDQWNQMAWRWDCDRPPLRPSQLDVVHYQNEIDVLADYRSINTAAILGFIREFRGLAWPTGTRVICFEDSLDMIERVGCGRREEALRWHSTDPAVALGSVQIVLCDGGLHQHGFPDGQERLVAQLARMLAPGGRAVFRLFLPPDPCPSPYEVLDRLEDGAIANMSELKLALGHAMTTQAAQGVSVNAIWHRLHERIGFEKREQFFDLLGWPRCEYEVIDLYRDSPVQHHFASLEEVLTMFCGKTMEGVFRLVRVSAVSRDEPLPCWHLTVERK